MWISARSSRAGREAGARVRARVTRARAFCVSFCSCSRTVAEAISSGAVGSGSGAGSGFGAKALEEKAPVELRSDFSRLFDLEAEFDFRCEARCFAIVAGETLLGGCLFCGEFPGATFFSPSAMFPSNG